MLNEDIYKKEVNDGSLIRYEINEDHYPVMNQINKVFKAYFNKPSSIFKSAKDLYYYKGGWPKADTPSRAYILANKIYSSFMVLSYLGLDKDLNKHLNEFGLELKIIDENSYFNNFLLNDIDFELDKKRKKIVLKNWNLLFDNSEDNLKDPKLVLSKLMTLACEKQKTICGLADEIKITKGDLVEKECEVKKKNFCKAVSLKYKINKGKSIEKDLDLIDNNIKAETEAVLDMFNSEV